MAGITTPVKRQIIADKEDKAMWPKGRVYQDAPMNELFLAFRQGVAYGRAIGSPR